MGLARRTAVCSLVVAWAATGTAWALQVGEAAPELRITHWLKGQPVKLADARGKNVVVVEFWGTQCPPCLVSIPKLSKLQARHKDAGLLIVGVSSEETSVIKAWMAKNAKLRMDYTVAADPIGETVGPYMRGGPGTIPHAFVVDKQGRVVWEGNPLEGLEVAVRRVLAGTYDVSRAIKAKQLHTEFMDAVRGGNMQKGLEICDRQIAIEPENPGHYEWKIRVLDFLKRPGEVVATRVAMTKAFAGDPDVLAKVASDLATDADLAKRAPAPALESALKAVAATSRKNPDVLGVLARVYAAVGLVDKAIAVQQEAVALAGDGREDLKEALAYFIRAQAVAKEHVGK